MSDLFRKEALENRSRALYGEVTLKNSLGNWVLTLLVITAFLLAVALLFGAKVETNDGPISLIKWLLSQA
jgi:hypothetical protein